jgi:hypothetical protein
VNRARKFTPQARVMYFERRRAKTHMTQVPINNVRCKHARAIGLGEGRGPTWPVWTHHVDGGVWNAWVCACANHTRLTRGTRRELGSEISRNEELVKIYQKKPHKSPDEVSRIRRVLLGTAAQLRRNNYEIKTIHIKKCLWVFELRSNFVRRALTPISKCFDHICVSYDRLNTVAESGSPLGCAHIGGKSTYATSCVSPTAACPTPPSVAFAVYLRDRRISIYIAGLCARYSFRVTNTATV